jgi:rubrerythrin
MERVGRTTKVRQIVRQTKGYALFCEMCGTAFETDPESGERRCPLCDIPEE